MFEELSRYTRTDATTIEPAHLGVQALSWSKGGHRILCDVSLSAMPGQKVGVVGPNGSGKTSLLRCIYRSTRPDSGSVELDGTDVWKLSAVESARRIAVVLQEFPSDFGFNVGEIVRMGRIPFGGAFSHSAAIDHAHMLEALQLVGLAALERRNFATLSGGEKQRALIARALVQAPRLMILDEPTNHLDILYQIDMLQLLRELPVTVLLTLHDLNLAAAYCDVVYVMHEGRIVASGIPAEVFQRDLIRDVFGVMADIELHPTGNRPRIHFRQTTQATQQ